MSPTQPLIRCRSLLKVYRVGTGDVLALQGLDLDVGNGELLGVIGASGSGKSTLLSILGGLVAPTAGTVIVDDVDLLAASPRRRARYRRETVGFVWQHSHLNLLPDLTATENVVRPIAAGGRRSSTERARHLLDLVGLGQRVDHRPALLSGGEQARVALAVALAHEPRLLLADEPTGELDGATTSEVFALMRELTTEHGVTQVVVSHDPDLVDHVDRVVGIRDGRTSTEMQRSTDETVRRSFVVDDVGRVQLPADVVDALGIGSRVSIDVVDGRAVIEPLDAPPDGGTGVDDA